MLDFGVNIMNVILTCSVGIVFHEARVMVVSLHRPSRISAGPLDYRQFRHRQSAAFAIPARSLIEWHINFINRVDSDSKIEGKRVPVDPINSL